MARKAINFVHNPYLAKLYNIIKMIPMTVMKSRKVYMLHVYRTLELLININTKFSCLPRK